MFKNFLPLLLADSLPQQQREDLEFSVGSKATIWEVKDPLLTSGGDYEEDNSDRHTYSSLHMNNVPAVPPMPPLMNSGGYSTSASSGLSAYKAQGGVSPGSGYGPGKGARGYPPNAGGGYWWVNVISISDYLPFFLPIGFSFAWAN